MKPQKNRKRLKQTPWIPGNPLHSRPGWYMVKIGRNVHWAQWKDCWVIHFMPGCIGLGYDPDFFKGVQR